MSQQLRVSGMTRRAGSQLDGGDRTDGSGFDDPSAEVLVAAAGAFGLLASPARLHIVWAPAQGESDVTGLAERVGGALPAVSQPLIERRLAGLVRSLREGRRQVYLVDDPDTGVPLAVTRRWRGARQP